MVGGRVPAVFFARAFLVVPVLIVEKTIFSSIELSWHLCQKSLDLGIEFLSGLSILFS